MCEGCRAYVDKKCKIMSAIPHKGKCGFYETDEQYYIRQNSYYNRLKKDFSVRRNVTEYLSRSFEFSAKNHLAQQAAEFGVELYDE